MTSMVRFQSDYLIFDLDSDLSGLSPLIKLHDPGRMTRPTSLNPNVEAQGY